MAVAGSVSSAIEMYVQNGALCYGKTEQRLGVVKDVDLAVHRLLANERVWVTTFTTVREGVARTVNATLATQARAQK